jgi:hypothetical protein
MADKKKQFVNVLKDLLHIRGSDSLGDQVYFPHIPEKKLENIRKKLKIPPDEDILILFDDTVFGSAKDGMICTTKGIRYSDINDVWAVSWKDLHDNGFENISKNDKRLIINVSDGMSSSKIDFHFFVAKIDSGLMIKILQIGSCIFGDEKDTNINTVAQLFALLNEPYPLGLKNNKQNDDWADNEDDYEDEDDDDDLEEDNLEDYEKADVKEEVKQIVLENEVFQLDKIDESDQSTDIKLDKITEPITIVYEKNDDHEPVANLLYNLVQSVSTVEPAIKTTTEYEASLFEDELLGETKDKYVIFLGKATATISGSLTWKYSQSGIKYGWSKKKGGLIVEKALLAEKAIIEETFKTFISDFLKT